MTAIWDRTRWAGWGKLYGRWQHILVVGAIYLALTLAVTWPLVLGLGRDVPSDLADPVLNCWILAWGGDHVLRLFGGEWGAFQDFWNTNAFYPHVLTLAYSEHLIVPAIQAAPIYGLTGNVILAYNVLFLSTFVLSGIGAYLLALDLIGDRRAAFVAGLLFAFTPYRFDQIPHLQVMSSQWMPFALLGFGRYVATRRLRYWVGGLAALICQALSCGYYLLFFSPFVALYALWQMARRGLLRDVRLWLALAAAALVFALVTLPFLLPYAELRKIEPTMRGELTVRVGSADVFSYVSSSSRSPLWGSVLTTIRRGEGQLFPGLAALLLAASAVVAAAGRRLAGTKPEIGAPLWRRLGARVALGAIALLVVAVLLNLAGARMRVPLGVTTFRISTLSRALGSLALAVVVLLWLSRRARDFCAGWTRSTTLFLVLFGALAAYLSLGPVPYALSRPLELPSLYGLLHDYVPGFDGLRVPARYAMIVVLALALLGGLGAAALRRMGTWGSWLAALLAMFFLIEAPIFPLPLNGSWGSGKVRAAAAPALGDQTPAVYRYVQTLPKDAVLLEMPIGYTCHETRYMLYSTLHWRRIVNGYSGYFPEGFLEQATALKRIVGEPGEALAALRGSGATHVIVHRTAWRGRRAERVLRTLLTLNLKVVADFGDSVVLTMPASDALPSK